MKTTSSRGRKRKATTSIRIKLPRPHRAQRHILRTRRRFNVLVCGRRWGKTTLALCIVVPALIAGQSVGWFAPNMKYLLEAWRFLVRILRPITAYRNGSEHRIELITGGVLEAWTIHDPDAGRSRKYHIAVIDEAAKARHLKVWWEEAGRSTLIDYQGEAWFLSTPKGKNFFHTLFAWGRDNLDGEWQMWRMPTASNPHVPSSEVRKMRKQLPRRVYRQEVEAAFLDDGGGVFQLVREAATGYPMKPYEGTFVIGADWGRTTDYTVFVVMDASTKQVVEYMRFSGVRFRIQRQRLKKLYEKWGASTILAEENSLGKPNVEALQEDGLPVRGFYTSNETKAHIIESLVLGIENGEVELLDDEIMIDEFQCYEQSTLPSGRIRYSAPDGMHDDVVIATALAYEAAGSGYGFEAWGDDEVETDEENDDD